MKTLAEALMKTENSNQGTDKNNQGLMCRCKKYIAYILLVMIIIGPIVSIIVLLVQRHQSFCPDDWIGFQDKCYYFSEKEGDWKSSKDNCTTAHADLTTIDTDKEMSFLSRYKCSSDHWIGLKMTKNQTGQWVNGNTFSKWFNVKGSEECAYLNDNGVGTARCYTERKWICRKNIH
ncbi:C-type lectin domain family 2 member B isoform X2 [Lemur catta]|uniref:C-type lectin domain family 2 member B isoform X2 n=1 Tax=Lemur catta TaxID=9447 RepID=UPI001E26B96E|nr:C-type lectin domain family 2 member B isoform X2 [Lemur catta]